MPDDLARRALFGRAATALAAVSVLPAEALGKKKRKKKKSKRKNKEALTAFVLVTGCSGNVVPPCACNACEKHAANKLFASREAVVRAHTGCNCQVAEISLPPATWRALFQPRGLQATASVDKRDPRVQQIL